MAASSDVAIPTISDAALKAIDSFESAILAGKDAGMTVANVADILGNGFNVLSKDNKSKLVDVPFAILGWDFHDGDIGTFVSFRIVTQNGTKLIVNDWSTGIMAQLAGLEPCVLLVPKGLRVSEYHTDKNGKPTRDPAAFKGMGRTYYLSTNNS